ncbi:MAG: hypothetical protein PUA84_09795, partial [Oscillospiraceae bacterium]|nr:hypothetical protein [Oscillospiraceae bacterium]
MKKMKRILAVISAIAAAVCVSSVSASAYTKDDIVSVNDHSVTFKYEGSDYDMITIADNKDDCRYICTKASSYTAVVMENSTAVLSEEELHEINENYTAVPAEKFEYNGRYSGEYGAMNLNDLDLGRTYIINCGSTEDRSRLYDLTGVSEVYEMTGTAYTNGWVDTDGKTYIMTIGVPAGKEFTAEDCKTLPCAVESIEYKRTYNEMDIYNVTVQYDDDMYKSIFDMQLAALELMDGNVSASILLTHLMTGSDSEGLYLISPIEREPAIGPITDKPLEAPLGYTQFDDKGLLETYGNAPYFDDYVYAAYRRNGEEQTD